MAPLFWAVVCFFAAANVIAGPIVETKSGPVEGTRDLYKLRPYEEYLGIPFAAPPVGDLRWQRPQPVTPWTEVRNATQYSIHCTQLITPLYRFIGYGDEDGEDCLYLNVYVPYGVEANNGTLLPVMFWVYGGAFMFGMGEMYEGYALALHGNVVVVNFNYRLNTLGFLSTGDDALPGNYGLWDVQAALRWVQENIAAFSGDPTRVTVFGQSAGGAITSHTVISPQTRGLFQSAIAISGSSSGFFGIQRQPLRTAALLSDIFNCTNIQTPTDLVECLRNEDAKDLDFWGVVGQALVEKRLPSFCPVVDGVFVPLPPVDAWKNGYGSDVNFMTGSTYDDAAGFVILNPIAMPALGDKGNWAKTNETWWAAMRFIVGLTENEDELILDIISQYPDLDTTDNYTRTLATTRAMTEWWFGSGSNFEASQHAGYGSGKSTYHYQFQHRQSFLVGYPDWVNGSHIDDLYSLFGDTFMRTYRNIYLGADYDDTDYAVSDNIMDYYTNFAHTGNPNVGPNPVSVEWTEFDPAQQNFMHEAPNFSVENVDAAVTTNYAYWMDFYSKLELPPDPTFPLPDGRRVVTEEELEVGVEMVREWMLELLDGREEEIDMMMDTIDEIVERRKMRFNL